MAVVTPLRYPGGKSKVYSYICLLYTSSANGETTYETRKRLAAKVFRHTAAYDALIAEYFTAQVGEEKPEKLTLTYDLKPVSYTHLESCYRRVKNMDK